MIDHHRARELFALSFDFDLEPNERAALLAHLDDCGPCRALTHELDDLGRSLAELPATDAPDRLRQRVLDAADIATPTTGRANVDAVPERSRLIRAVMPPYRSPAAMVAMAAVVIVAVVAGALNWPTPRPHEPSESDAIAAVSPTPAGSDIAPASPTPAASVEPGASQDPASTTPPTPGYTAVADLTATEVDGAVLALGSGFRLASLDGTSATDLAERLSVEPTIKFTIEQDADGAALLTPDEPLTQGTVYQFTLSDKAGQTLDTWAFQARQSLRVVSTVPSDTATVVPLDTGIEVTFDQDGVTDAAEHMTIEPRVDGRFEQHGRVLAFVPDQPLAPATLYTVSISPGVPVKGTGEVLEEAVTFRFETAATEGAARETTFQFEDDMFESATGERPVIALWAFDVNEDGSGLDHARIEVYRLPDLGSAIDAFRRIRGSARWARFTSDDLVPTDRLRRIAALDAPLEDTNGILWFALPERLPAGSYLVQHPSPIRPMQAILQVTDVATLLTISERMTLAWVNDLASGDPLSGAVVTVDGAELGRTGADGSLLVDSPAALLAGDRAECGEACPVVITVRSADGRVAFMPASRRPSFFGSFVGCCFDSFSSGPAYWNILHTDRQVYRRTDTINVWGALRDRDSGRVPESVALRLVNYEWRGELDFHEVRGASPVSSIRLAPRPTGVFAGSIALDDLPEGNYALELMVDGDVIDRRNVSVDRILKPAYRLEVETGHRVYFEGDQIKVTVRATSFEGTPIAGVPMRIGGYVEKDVLTDGTGTAVHRTTARVSSWNRGWMEDGAVSVNPGRAEEGDIVGASREILLFPSVWTVTGEGTIRGGRVRVTGSVHTVDRDRLERELAEGAYSWEVDPQGPAAGGAVVSAQFIEQIVTRRQTGTQYDFIEKRAFPVYEYDYSTADAGTVSATTNGDGEFTVSVPAVATATTYQVVLSTLDPDGHTATTFIHARLAIEAQDDAEPSSVWLDLTSSQPDRETEFGVGDPIDLTMRGGPADSDASDHFLFYRAQRGLRDLEVTSSPRFVTDYPAWAPPNLSITGVRFTGRGYLSASYGPTLRRSDRQLVVEVSTSRPRYAPGDDASVTVTTRDHVGRPVAATVVLSAVDEKLFAISAAQEVDPFDQLYSHVGDGIVASYASHDAPANEPGADTAGGDGDSNPRSDFRDTVLFQAIDTGADGLASVTFSLSDDLTSWRVIAAAVDGDLRAGRGTAVVPVGLPFFIDLSLAPEYLAADRPSIAVRMYGTSLDADADVTLTVESETLDYKSDTITARAFESVDVVLPQLRVGVHELTITARTGSGDSSRTDRLTRSFVVVASRLTRSRTAHLDLTDATGVEGGDGMTRLIVSDASAGRYVPLLIGLGAQYSARLERALAADRATAILVDRFAWPTDGEPPYEFEGGRYQTPDGGLALVPHGASDLEASTLAAIVAPDRVDTSSLESYFSQILGSPTETRERRMFALAGLAGLGSPVLPAITAAAADVELTIRERLIVGLGAAALGDGATARSIAAALSSSYREIADGRAFLRVGESTVEITTATALMATLAAATGDRDAAAYWAYVEANPNTEVPYELHAIGYIHRVLERVTLQPAAFAYTIDGERTVVDLKPGKSFELTLTPKQVGALTLERVSGSVGMTSSWREAVKALAFEQDPDVMIERTITPSGTIEQGDLVQVDLTVRFGPDAPSGCHLVTDLVPSGLVAAASPEQWGYYSNQAVPAGREVSWPFAQTAQRVSFCAETDTTDRVVDLRYYARVITTGTYIWEPAITESQSGANRAAVTEETVVEIR